MFLESPNGYVDPAPSVVSNLKTIPANTTPPELPPPPKWMRDATCLGEFELFDSLAEDLRKGPRLTKAKRICSGCPVKDLCLEMAMEAEKADTKNRFGVFGGRTPDERDALAGEPHYFNPWEKVCRNGHERTEENTLIRKSGNREGQRLCRLCNRDSRRRRAEAASR